MSRKVLFVASEIAPFAKVGGLADVLEALPLALAERGHDIRVLCPLYGSIHVNDTWKAHQAPLFVNLGAGGLRFARIWEAPSRHPNLTLYFLEYADFYQWEGVYAGPWGEHGDNGARFTFLSRAAIDLCAYLQWQPDVFHANDWPTGLLPVYLNTTEHNKPIGRAASVFTIHNMQHQGVFGKDLLEFAGIDEHVFRADSIEAFGQLNLLKGGLYHATKLTTVSKRYAQEIQQPDYGFGLGPVVRFRSADLTGIANGINTDTWNPSKDPWIAQKYSHKDLSGKSVCKAALQKELGLDVRPDIPIFSVVSRLYHQKGVDWLAEILPAFLDNMQVQFVLLGTGDKDLEHRFSQIAHQHPGRMATYIGYDNGLAHRVEAGSDFFVMPSRFEPCGLNQMYSMAYGTVPIVRATGGLSDTVDAYVEGCEGGTGFLFEAPNAHALYNTLGWACATYYDRPDEFRMLQLGGMKKDFSWAHSAGQYEKVYEWAIEERAKAF